MKAEIFRRGESFAEIVEFFKEKGFIEKSSDYIPDYLEGKNYSYFEISEDGTLLIVIEYSPEDKISDFEKELKNVFTEYMVLVKNDLSEYRFYKYDAGTDKILKLRKKRSDLEVVFLKKLESIEYNNLESIEALFDRSEFIKEFYQLYCDTESYLFRKIEGISDDHDRELFTKIILQRMMFLWFLQKKKLLDYNEHYFVEKHNQFFRSRTNFYDGFLKKLFLQGLCVKPEERSREINDLIGDVPYLNGGLFIESDIEQKYNDAIKIPNEAFYRAMTYPIGRGERNIPILNLLECKEWTVDERSGDVNKLNPEILGYIFEKSINKKDLGAVYTPEEITTYICKNTIHPYLLDRINEKFSTEYKDLDTIFKEGNKDQWEYLFEVLREIKIVDPAVGSGHFLVDAIVILERIYHKLRDKEIIGWSNYKIREQIIVNNLFGVDILEGAVEICKLRLFLALAETFRTKEDVQPLPNIDFNIRCGNSLIGFVSTDELTQNFFTQGDVVNALAGNMKFLEEHIPKVAKKAKEILSRFDIDPMDLFRLRTELVKRYRVLHDKELQPEMRGVLQEITDAFNRELNAQYYGKIQDVFRRDRNLRQLSGNERYQRFIELQPFHWVMEYSEVFENGGFDVVIGNPPYISNRNIRMNEKIIYNEMFKSAYKQYDIYIIFIERGLRLLQQYGEFSYIVSNKFLITEYGSKVRDLLINIVNTKSIIDISNVRVFKEAAVYPILIFVNYKQIDIPIAVGEGKDIISIQKIKISNISKDFFRKIPDLIIPTKLNETNMQIITKVINNFNLRYDFKCGIASSGYSTHIIEADHPPNHNHIPILQGEEIFPLSISNATKYIERTMIPSSKYDDFGKRKVVVPGMVKYLYAGLDMNGCALGRIYYITEDYEGVEKLYSIIALLNSSLFRYVYDVIYGSSHLAGGYLRVNAPYLKIFSFPTKIPKELNKITRYILLQNDNCTFMSLLNYLVYELYFKEKLGTNLCDLISPYLIDIEDLPDDEKLETIEKVVERIKSDERIQKEIEKIKSHPWVKIIEEEVGGNSSLL